MEKYKPYSLFKRNFQTTETAALPSIQARIDPSFLSISFSHPFRFFDRSPDLLFHLWFDARGRECSFFFLPVVDHFFPLP